MLSGGGTGGHIYPAIAIADELKNRYPGARFLFVGASNRMEMEKVPQAGYEIRGLWISGLARKLSWKNLLFPIKLISSLMKARRIIREFQPHLVVGTGGYASGPTLRMASAMGVPCVLQEQNSFAGITNKWLAGKAERIFVAYEGMERFFPADRIRLTGNPVRSRLAENIPGREEALAHFDLDSQRKTLLVIGGSQGAGRINSLVASRLDFFAERGVQLLWQCGRIYYDKYRELEADTVRVRAFIPEMEAAYAAADLIISRAGAGTVSELCLVGKPVLFIPSPNVAEDHQAKNARALVEKEAALCLAESELESGFEARFSDLLDHPGLADRLGSNIRALARPEATKAIVDEMEQLLNNA